MESAEARDLAIDEGGGTAEGVESHGERGVALVDVGVEAVVRRHAACGFPHALGRIEIGRVRRQAVKLDAMGVAREPRATSLIEPVAGAIVDDEEDFATSIPAHE